MEHLSRFSDEFLQALRNLLPIVIVVVFQVLVFRSVPDDTVELVVGSFAWRWASRCSCTAWT